jgi:hypothetical protein
VEGGQRLDDATIERARSTRSLGSLVGRRVKLRRSGRGWSGLCPFHAEKTPSFHVVEEKGFYHCFGCGAHGDAIRWLMETEGLDFRRAVESLLGGQLPDARKPARIAERPGPERGNRFDVVPSSTAGRWIFRTSGPARGEIVERWLESRGLDPFLEPMPGVFAIDALRYHPRCPVSVWRVDQDPRDVLLTRPAMVAPIADAEGAVWGVHVTYLSPDGRSKAQLPPAGGRERPTRKIFGSVGRNAVFLTPPEAMCSPLELLVGEGIETTWAFAQQRGRPCRLVATLSLENLQGGAVKLRDGSLPLWKIEPDPERSPFVLPDAGEVTIAIDADMKPLRDQKVQLERGAKPVRIDLDGLKRAEICASLAIAAWRRAGATSVRAVRPRMGMDFNDQVRGVAA